MKMDKTEFEATDRGIDKGDLILVLRTHSFFPDKIWALSGIYDPIEDEQHWYVQELKSTGDWEKYPKLREIINNAFVLCLYPTIDKYYLHFKLERSDPTVMDIRYDKCMSVKLLLKASELEQLINKRDG